jgi:hypothetical protein
MSQSTIDAMQAEAERLAHRMNATRELLTPTLAAFGFMAHGMQRGMRTGALNLAPQDAADILEDAAVSLAFSVHQMIAELRCDVTVAGGAEHDAALIAARTAGLRRLADHIGRTLDGEIGITVQNVTVEIMDPKVAARRPPRQGQ